MEKYDGFDRDLIYSKDQKEEFVYKHSRGFHHLSIPRVLDLTRYHLKNMLRDKLQLIFIIGFPIILIILFSIQAESVSNISYDIIIINNDVIGFEDDPEAAFFNTSASIEFINLWESEEFKDYVDIVGVNDFTLEQAQEFIENERYDGLIVIEQYFTEKLLYETTKISGNLQIEIITINDELAYNLITKVSTQIINSISLELYGGKYANLEIQNDLNFAEFTFFDLFFPSILIASILVCISQVATHFAGEKESGIIKRLSTTAVSRSQILISGALAQFLITSFQIILMLAIGTSLGVDIHMNASWILIFIILWLVTCCSLGIGLLLASFLKTYNQAGIFSWFIILPLLFLGGIFTYGVEFKYSFLFPTYWASHALQMVMLHGINSWDIIGLDIIYCLIFTILIMNVGLLLFQRKKSILT